jgi:Ser-tRNA(Ala) deacylase AlaX
MTERLYYQDSYLTEFRARVVEASPDQKRIYLDRTAFYPTSGGQPFDIGKLGGVEVIEVIDEGDRIAHVLSDVFTGSEVEGRIHRARRFDHMQQHTGQHLLSAVLIEMFDAPTVSFHLGAESSTIDVTRALEPAQLREAERRANEIVFENRPVTVSYQHSSEDLGLRKPTEREGEVRIISIQDLDRSACGGTHVRATGEIGPILLRKLDRIRGNLRIEFLCGGRAVGRAREDFEALSKSHACSRQPWKKRRRWLRRSAKSWKRQTAHAGGWPPNWRRPRDVHCTLGHPQATMAFGERSAVRTRYLKNCEPKRKASLPRDRRFSWRWLKPRHRFCWRRPKTAAFMRAIRSKGHWLRRADAVAETPHWRRAASGPKRLSANW